MQGSRCDSQAGGVAVGEEVDAPWLAAYTRPRHELQVSRWWNRLGLEVFLPCHRSWRLWSDRRKLLEIPLFPSYVFVRWDQRQHQHAVQAPGFLWFVHNRTGPVQVNAMELAAVRAVIASDLQFDPMPNVAIGDEVEIVHGALRGFRGYLLSKDTGTIVLRVAAVQGGLRVRLPDPSWVRTLARGRS